MNTEFLMDDYCFACGKSNENGLRLRILESDDGVRAAFIAPKWAQGYKNVVHGGIISTILDEMAVWAAYKSGYKSVTAELNVRIKQAMKIGREYSTQAKVIAVKHQLVTAASKIVDENNTLIALADVKLIKND